MRDTPSMACHGTDPYCSHPKNTSMLPEHLRDLVSVHIPVTAAAEAGPSASALTDAPDLDRWIAMQEFIGRIVLFGT